MNLISDHRIVYATLSAWLVVAIAAMAYGRDGWLTHSRVAWHGIGRAQVD